MLTLSAGAFDSARRATSTEVAAALIGAGVGAAAGYGFGSLQSILDRRRRRKAAATALLAEIYWLTYSLETLRGDWPGYRVSVKFTTTVHDKFEDFLELFSPLTVYAVLDCIGTVRDIQTGMTALWNETVNRDRIKGEVRTLAGTAISKALASHNCLAKEGGIEPRMPVWPSGEQRDAFVRKVISLWDTRLSS